jgi:hypothetical protein
MFELDFPSNGQSPAPVDETDEYTLRVIDGIRRLKELAPTIKECKNTKEVNNIRLNCQLIQTYAMSRKLDKELVLWAQRCNLMCVRRIGEILMEMREKKQRVRGGELRKKVTFERDGTPEGGPLTLKDLELSTTDASDAVAIAGISESELEEIAENHLKENRSVNIKEIAVKARRRRSNKPEITIRKKPVYDNFSVYWKQEIQLLDKSFSVEMLEKLPEIWQKNLAEYLTKRKAEVEKVRENFFNGKTR